MELQYLALYIHTICQLAVTYLVILRQFEVLKCMNLSVLYLPVAIVLNIALFPSEGWRPSIPLQLELALPAPSEAHDRPRIKELWPAKGECIECLDQEHSCLWKRIPLYPLYYTEERNKTA